MSRLKTLKRAPSAYNLYIADKFEELGSLAEVAKKWKTLSEEEKAPYERKADLYRREFAAGNKVVRRVKGEDGRTSFEFVKVDVPEGEEAGPTPPAPPRTKRPPNLYQQFIAREDVKERLRGLSVEDRRARLKELWQEEKDSGRVVLKGKQRDAVEGIAKGPVKAN